MFYREWEPFYKKIIRDLNLCVQEDIEASDVLNNLLKQKNNLYPLEKLEDLISDNEVFIFGAGPSLTKSISLFKEKFEKKLKIAADGATTALMDNNILPDIIVTDLDGKVSDQLRANKLGSVVIAHAHGDNINNIKKFIPHFKVNIIGSTQVDPRSFDSIYNFGGFTDGDRAVFLSDHFKAKKISLIGFDFNANIGRYSFPDKKNKNLKIKKLKVCQNLIEKLKEKNNEIYFLHP
jgi:hypothetical protein